MFILVLFVVIFAASNAMPCDLKEGLNSSSSGEEYGFDISTTVSSSSASCFVSSGMSFVVPRAYKSSCSVDTQACTSIINAKNAGIKRADVYLFPSPTCSKSADAQMKELLNYMNGCKSEWSGRVWLDIEGTQYWLGSTDKNRAWYQDLVAACDDNGVTCGVYASSSQWSAIFGSTSYCYGSELPLWYAHYDNNPSFSDYKEFGCWKNPHVKQYAGDVSSCSMGVDKNYSPAF